MLRPGAVIAVIAPAGPPDLVKLEAGVRLLREWGYVVVKGRHVESRTDYLAGTVEERTSDLIWALSTEGIDCVWAARGGFGSAHCLPHVPWGNVGRRLFIGFSDITALLGALHARTAATPIHGPTLDRLAERVSEETRVSMRELLTMGPTVKFPVERICGASAEIGGIALGGNLSVLAGLVGTPWEIGTRDCIWIFEDIREPAYKIDRMFSQLREGGAFAGARAIVVGDFTACNMPNEKPAAQFIAQLLSRLDIPVLSGIPIGHGVVNYPWYYGGPAILRSGFLEIGPR